MKNKWLTELDTLQPYDNTDRAYILIHNLQLYLKKDTVLPSDIKLIDQCLVAIKAYRTATAAGKETLTNQLQDGFLNDYWARIETSHEKERDTLQSLSRKLWHEKLTPLLNHGDEEPIINLANVVVDVQNDFSASASFTSIDKGREVGKASLPVTPSEDICDNINSINFRIEDPTLIVFTRDMHPADAIWNQIKPGVPFDPKAHRFQLLAAEVIEKHQDCGHVCWGCHCTVNTHESDFIAGLALHPDAMYVAKGTNKYSHPYGAAVIDNAVLAKYFAKKGIQSAIILGWATDYCVADTAKGLIAGDINVIMPTPCCGGIAPQFKGDRVKTEDIAKVVFEPDANRLSIETFAVKQKIEPPADPMIKLYVVNSIESAALNEANESFAKRSANKKKNMPNF